MKCLGGLISVAARLVKGNCLHELYEVCENNKTVSTRKLRRIVHRLDDSLKEEGIFIRIIHNKAKEELKKKSSKYNDNSNTTTNI